MNGFSRKKRIHSLWKRIVAAMCCVVVFITTYAMILPAITLDSETAENEPGITVTADAETSAVSMTEEDPAAEGETEPADAEQPDIGSEAGPADSGTEPVKEHAETVPAEDESADPENTEPENTETEKTAADPEETEPEPGAPEEEDGAQIADPEYRPACSLRARAGDVLVSVEAPEGAFPANVVMEAVIIEDETVLSAIADTVEGRVRAIQAVDITFYDENGAEIQPAIPITVTMSSEVTERAEEIQVIHVDEDLNTEVVSEAETREDNCVEFSAGDFSVYAIVEYETITGLYLTSDGSTYEVTVRYTEEAGIPDGAELHVSELTENDAGYSYYLSRTADALGAQNASISYIKLLDIEITGADGAKKEPTAQVDVSVRLIDRAETGDPAHVVHFGEKTEELGSSSDGDIVSFCTDGFSVYAIADVQDPSELDGHSFGIINTVDGTKPSGTAVLAESTGDNLDRLKGKSTTVRVDVVSRDSNVYIPKDSDITMWTFSSCGDGKYYITADVDGQLRYLRISSDGVYLTDADSAVNDEDCRISVTKNNSTGSNAGKFKFSTGNGTLQLSGGNFRRARTNENGNAVWMSFAELSNLNEDDFVTYTAQKVSVSGKVNEDGTIDYDVEDGDKVILYTRIWNEQALRYDYYIIDYDGKLVKAYEGGDTISWVGSKVNTMLWDFTEYHYDDGKPNYYYELQNSYSGKYIAPQVSGTGFLSDDTIGVNLNGRRYNEYYTTILAWDDPYYDYASLKVQDKQLISAPMARADDFYFAIMTKDEGSSGNEPTPVATIDHTAFGITLKMQDYGNITTGDVNRSKDQYDILGDTDYVQWTGTPGLVARNLGDDGYPVTTDKVAQEDYLKHKTLKGSPETSLAALYSDALTVNNNFLLSTYNETGYFEYDSTQNFAHLIISADDYWYGKDRPGGGTYGIGDFVVYDELATSNEGNKDTLRHGQFLPYNDIMVKNSSGEWVPRNYSAKYVNEMDIHAQPLSSLDPRKGESLYEIPYSIGRTAPGYVDHFFGMELSASFMQNENGLDAWGHDLIFEFSGDDDFWLYIDGMLVLDLGGIHSALDGSVNFRTGEVVVNGNHTDLRTVYKEAYMENNPDASEAEVNEWLNGIFKDGGTVFRDYTGHTMRMFYMERGAGASNLHMRFNLAPYVDGEVLLEKEVTGTENVDMTFPFQIWFNDEFSDFITAKGNGDYGVTVTDAQTGENVPYQAYYSAGGVTYNDVFFLKPGQTVSIKLPGEDTEYYIKECALDTSVFDQVTVNGDELEADEENPRDFSIEDTTVARRKKIIYENRVSDNALRDLHITKRLWQDNEKTDEIFSGDGDDRDNTEFKFRVYIGTDGNGNYEVYNTGKYYVKDPQGHYCVYENGGFVSTGKTDLSDLDTTVPDGEWKSEREKATFYSSPGGAIDKIRAGYTIEIPELLPGTPFKIEEHSGEIPTGYNLLGYTLTDGPYSSENQGTEENTGTVSADGEDTVSVHNQHGFGLKTDKVWSDAAFMSMHDPVYYAVYLTGSDTPLEGSVRKLEHPATSLKWFFPSLAAGKTLNDYEVYEVILEGNENDFTVDPSTGAVSGYTGIERIDEPGTIEVWAEGNAHGYADTYIYDVSYERETLTPEQIADNVNSRTDTVYNSRTGIRIVKTDMDDNPLAGAVFELEWTDPDGEVRKKRFTSDDNGLVMVAYLKTDTDYVIREIAAPYGYRTWIFGDITLKVDSSGQLLVTVPEGSDAGAYTVTQVEEPTPDNMSTLTVRNKPSALRAVKVDLDSGLPMKDVTFSLYREVHEAETGNPMPDYTPMEGYEELVTDSDGIIPKIVLRNSDNPDGLRPGVYYLRETQTPSRYDPLGYDIRITISSTGEITLDKARRPEQTGSWTISDMTEDLAEITEGSNGYLITVKNHPKDPVRIRKVNTSGNTLSGVAFSLYKAGQIGSDGKPKEGEIPILSGTTAEGLFNMGGLEENTSYYLFETATPDGYRLPDYPVLINSVGADNITASMNGAPLDAQKITEDGNSVWEITVINYNSIELPETGGPGTALFHTAGAALSGIPAAALISRKRKRTKGRAGP